MDILDRYMWILFVGFASAAVVSIRSKLDIHGWRSAVVALATINLPFLLTGYGMLVHPRPTDSFALFGPSAGWLALALVLSVAANWVGLLWWLYAREGAERIAASAAVRTSLRVPADPNSIRLLAVVCVAGGILGLVGLLITQR